MLDVKMQHRYADVTLAIAFDSAARNIALFGDSGAGKTSVLDAIAGLLTPQSGRIALDGEVWFDSSAGIAVPTRQRAIGYVFQDGRLFPHLDVRANLLYGARSRSATASDFDDIVGLLSLAALLPRKPDSLSGGERQRVAIGRALLSAPRVLLLDEPMTGLHREARADVLEHLQRLRQQRAVTTLLVSHHPAEVLALAEDVVLIDDGRVSGRCDIDAFRRLHGGS